MGALTEGLPTESAKIRALDAAGVARADIARFLDIRYQRVRYVLLNPPKKLATGMAEKGAEFDHKQDAAFKVQVAAAGRNPDGRGSVEAHALLPMELRQMFPSEQLDQIKAWAADVVERGAGSRSATSLRASKANGLTSSASVN